MKDYIEDFCKIIEEYSYHEEYIVVRSNRSGSSFILCSNDNKPIFECNNIVAAILFGDNLNFEIFMNFYYKNIESISITQDNYKELANNYIKLFEIIINIHRNLIFE